MAKKKLLMAAVVVGALAAFLLYLFASQVNEEKRELIGEQVEVVKASRQIPLGTSLTRDMVVYEPVPKKFLPPNPVYPKDFESIYMGLPVSVNVQDGAMILTSDFAQEQVSNELSGKVPMKERALTVSVDEISGVAGLLAPGDRVDILGTFPVSDKDQLIPDASGGEGVGYVTMTLLQNVTLLAVGQVLSEVGMRAENGGGRQGYGSVTMAVTIDEAELLTIAQTRGKLVMLLRNRDDVEVAPVSKRTLKQVLQDLDVIQSVRVEREKVKPVARRATPKQTDPGIVVETGGNR
jgi:pilus assembly protein CpaB